MKRKNIKRFFRPLQSEEGSVIVMVMLILVVLTLIGISASSTSVVEVQIASNDHFYKIAFYNADAGIYGTAKLISRTLNNSAGITSGPGTDAPEITYLLPAPGGTDASIFYGQIMDFDPYDLGPKDVMFPIGLNSVEVDVERGESFTPAGGGSEFGSGAEGSGVAVVAIPFDLDSVGDGPRLSISNIIAGYRKYIPGIGL